MRQSNSLKRLLGFIIGLYLLTVEFFTVGRILPESMLCGKKPGGMNLFNSLHNRSRKHGPALMRSLVCMSSYLLALFTCITALTTYFTDKVIVAVFRAQTYGASFCQSDNYYQKH